GVLGGGIERIRADGRGDGTNGRLLVRADRGNDRERAVTERRRRPGRNIDGRLCGETAGPNAFGSAAFDGPDAYVGRRAVGTSGGERRDFHVRPHWRGDGAGGRLLLFANHGYSRGWTTALCGRRFEWRAASADGGAHSESRGGINLALDRT